MNKQDLEHALAEGRTVEARHHGGGWFRPTNPQQLLERGVELRVIELRNRMEKMAPSERIDMVNTIMAGHCKHCGNKDPDGSCKCWNDE